MQELELGLKAKDKISGMSGILTAKCEFLTGCNRWCITPQELKDGRPIEGMYFDEAQIDVVGEGILPSEVTGKERGACSPDAKK